MDVKFDQSHTGELTNEVMNENLDRYVKKRRERNKFKEEMMRT